MVRRNQGADAPRSPSPPLAPELDYCCPRCRGPLETPAGGYRCAACDAEYPEVLGIPDFRVFPDPYIGLEEDRAKARRLAQRARHTDFKGLLDYYWSITPGTPPDLARRYVRHALASVERGRHALRAATAALPGVGSRGGRLLDLGCGTGGFLGPAAERFPEVVGVDIALRWLVLAQKRLEEAGVPARLVCCCAEQLPFRAPAFDLVLAGDVLEHTSSPAGVLREAWRVLRPGGGFFASTPNRYAVRRDPHVQVWGVGWLPRRWADGYVRWRRGVPYRHIRLLSGRALQRLARRSPFAGGRVLLPSFGEGELEGLSPRERRLVALYHRVRDWPLLRRLLFAFGPALQLACLRAEERA